MGKFFLQQLYYGSSLCLLAKPIIENRVELWYEFNLKKKRILLLKGENDSPLLECFF